MKINELLVEFDEMGFAPTTLCGNPNEYAREWKKKLVAEIKRLNTANERFEINITKQENEIEYRKKQYDNQIAENTRLHIEYDKAFERLKAQQREIDRLKIQLEQANARIVNCSGSELDETNAVKEFAEELKAKTMCIKEYEDGTRILQTSNKLIDQSVKIFLTNY